MRLWVKPDQLAKLGITVTEIVSAISRKIRSIRGRSAAAYSSRASSSPMRCGRRAAWSHQKNSGEIVVREYRRVAWCGSRMSPGRTRGAGLLRSWTTER
jgi:multidrug efflux pump subunit AcrB